MSGKFPPPYPAPIDPPYVTARPAKSPAFEIVLWLVAAALVAWWAL